MLSSRITALARPVSALPAGTALSRFIVALARTKGDPQAAASTAEHSRRAVAACGFASGRRKARSITVRGD